VVAFGSRHQARCLQLRCHRGEVGEDAVVRIGQPLNSNRAAM
jgi:hypothetical protein